MATVASAHDTETVALARADARAQGGRVADAMPYLPASSTPYPPAGVDKGKLTWAETVAGGNYTHQVVARGTRIRLTDVTGEACAHVLLYNVLEPWERLNVADTVKIPWQAYLTTGQHDAFCGTTTAAASQAKYGDSAPQGPSPSGRELFTLAAAKHGLTRRDLPPSVSFFKGVRVAQDGSLEFTGSAGPGKSVDLLAELPLIVLIANVPHPADPRPAYTCGPLRLHAWRSAPTDPADPRLNGSPEARRAYLNTAGYLAARGL